MLPQRQDKQPPRFPGKANQAKPHPGAIDAGGLTVEIVEAVGQFFRRSQRGGERFSVHVRLCHQRTPRISRSASNAGLPPVEMPPCRPAKKSAAVSQPAAGPTGAENEEQPSCAPIDHPCGGLSSTPLTTFSASKRAYSRMPSPAIGCVIRSDNA